MEDKLLNLQEINGFSWLMSTFFSKPNMHACVCVYICMYMYTYGYLLTNFDKSCVTKF